MASAARRIDIIVRSDGLQERAGHNIRMLIVSDVLQEGAVWPLHLVYNIIRSDELQGGASLYRVWIYIVRDMVRASASSFILSYQKSLY